MTTPSGTVEPAAANRIAYLTAGATGFVSMAGQVVWTRALLFFINNSSYAFSAVLTVYLAGLAAGAAAGAAVAARRQLAIRVLPWALVAQTAASFVAIVVYRNALSLSRPFLATPLPEGVSGLSGNYEVWAVSSWYDALASIFAQAGGVLILPSLVFGFTFPIALSVADSRNDAASTPRTIGRIYAINTTGSVLGTVLGTFAIVPLLGTPGSLLVLAVIPTAIALLAWHVFEPKRWISLARVAAAVFVMVLLARVVSPSDFYRQMFDERFGNVIWFHEGVSETIAICERSDGTPWIQYSDGRGASGSVSWKGGWLYAHLPLLLHPDPESCLIICFGTGNTLGAASRHELPVLDGVELSTGIIHAASIFRETNHDVGNNPDVNMIIDDGRNYLLGTPERYDVISEEPPLVQTAGVINLYTRDFYELCRDRLTSDGIVAVWLPTWSMEELEAQMLVRAFLDVFPDATAWESLHPNEWILIGTREPLQIDLAALRERMAQPGVAEDLRKLELDTPEALMSLYLNGPSYLREFCGDVPPATDDKSVVDFTMPRQPRSNFSLAGEVQRDVRMAGVSEAGILTDTRVRDFEEDIYIRREPASDLINGFGGFDPDSVRAVVDRHQQERALQAARRSAFLLCALAQDYYQSGQAERAMKLLGSKVEALPQPVNADLFAMRAMLLMRSGSIENAQQDLETALRIDPENAIARRVVEQARQALAR
jgi:spermidine synthase